MDIRMKSSSGWSSVDKTWQSAISASVDSKHLIDVIAAVNEQRKEHLVYPPSSHVFRAFELTPLSSVKVVILGQDPYHGPTQANGLSFSVEAGVRLPPSLKNIFKEIHQDLQLPMPTHGDLSSWAAQGVFLLNSTLTVKHKSPGSHQKMGWEPFTDQTIRTVSEKRDHVVFMLWGNFARAKKKLIDTQRHLVLEAPHPSPLSAYKGFLGCRHFSKANAYLQAHHMDPINWGSLSP
ncbi:MAG: uracil-DNA glycosylase [Cryomorphaceae bacterium]